MKNPSQNELQFVEEEKNEKEEKKSVCERIKTDKNPDYSKEIDNFSSEPLKDKHSNQSPFELSEEYEKKQKASLLENEKPEKISEF